MEIPGVGVNLVSLIPLNETALSTERTLDFTIDQLPVHKYAQGALDKNGDKLICLSKGYQLAPSNIWESDERRFVIRVPIRKKDSKKDFVVLHAWGVPRMVEDVANAADPKMVELRFEELDWNSETKNLLIKAVSWLAHDQIRTALQNNAKIPLAGLEGRPASGSSS